MIRFEIEPRGAYLYAAISGVFELSSALDSYRALLQAAARYRQPRMLLDCTRVTGEMTMSDRLAFGGFMAEEQNRMLAQLPAAPQVAISRCRRSWIPAGSRRPWRTTGVCACAPRKACRSCCRGWRYRHGECGPAASAARVPISW